MIRVTPKGEAFLRRVAPNLNQTSFSETLLAAIADRGPIEEEELEELFGEVGDITNNLNFLTRNEYAHATRV